MESKQQSTKLAAPPSKGGPFDNKLNADAKACNDIVKEQNDARACKLPAEGLTMRTQYHGPDGVLIKAFFDGELIEMFIVEPAEKDLMGDDLMTVRSSYAHGYPVKNQVALLRRRSKGCDWTAYHSGPIVDCVKTRSDYGYEAAAVKLLTDLLERDLERLDAAKKEPTKYVGDWFVDQWGTQGANVLIDEIDVDRHGNDGLSIAKMVFKFAENGGQRRHLGDTVRAPNGEQFKISVTKV